MKKQGLVMSVLLRGEGGRYKTEIIKTDARYSNRGVKIAKLVFGDQFINAHPYTGYMDTGDFIVKGCVCGDKCDMIGKRNKNKLLLKVNTNCFVIAKDKE